MDILKTTVLASGALIACFVVWALALPNVLSWLDRFGYRDDSVTPLILFGTPVLAATAVIVLVARSRSARS